LSNGVRAAEEALRGQRFEDDESVERFVRSTRYDAAIKIVLLARKNVFLKLCKEINLYLY